MNVIVIANLTMALTSESLTGMVYQPITIGWPSGLAHMVVDSLFNKYVPKYLVSKIDFCRALNAVIMKKEEDPENIFKAISGIDNKCITSTYQFSE